MIKQRSIIEYELSELSIIQKESQIFKNQIELNSLKCKNIIFENQEMCGKAVRNIFNNKSIINCIVYGPTQVGKTGCMIALILYYILSNNIPIDNIYIITGLSDVEWKKDTKNRMPDSITTKVFHRGDFKKFLHDIRGKKNCLIIMDEIQIACEDNQTINNTFEECKFYDLDFLLDNDIKIIQFSATPDGNMNDIKDWKHHSANVKLSPGQDYYGPKQAIEQERIKKFEDLTILDNVKELKNDIEERYSNPRYHLIRVPNKRENKDKTNNQLKVISNFKKVFEEKYEYNEKYLEAKKKDINCILEKKPEKSTFIFYCEILRCAKTQYKKYIGVSYERYSTNINDSTIVQGSFGRLCGYDDNGDSICYTNIKSIENYIKLWDDNMEFKKGTVWNTKTTQYNKQDDITYNNVGTFNSVKHIKELKGNCTKNIKTIVKPTIKIFTEFDEVKEFFKKEANKYLGTGPKKRIADNNGFYECITQIDKSKKVRTKEYFQKIEKENNWGFNNNDDKNKYRCYSCYSDITDPKTLEWWLVYHENKG
jgi:hypothetical protein|uniref:Helicase ATP-binding domain-containing protein n=1 Tax=viral metagenome TaxID=1070528 RepID=A0A6C0LZF1_9ZZZZ